MKLIVCLLAASVCFAATTNVPAGADLQQAINNAQPGDTLVLQAGATYAGNFVLPNLPGSSYVTITSSDLASLPPAGTRVNPSYAAHMPKITAPAGANWYSPIIATAPGAHHYQLVGLEVTPPAGQAEWNMVVLGAGDSTENSLSLLSHDFIVDRCYVHGEASDTTDSKGGVVINGVNMVVENNYISDLHSTWLDAAAVGGWAGTGPYRITNNYLESTGENLFFGGNAGPIPGVIPSNIYVGGNYIAKLLKWRDGDPTYAGTRWLIKNLLELKEGKNVTIEGNILEYSWAQGQDGAAVLFTDRTEGDPTTHIPYAPWYVIDHVIFRDNIVRHASAGIVLQGQDNLANFTGSGNDAQIYNNLFYDIDHTVWGGPYSDLAMVMNGFTNIKLTHNTAVGFEWVSYFGGPDGGPASTGYVAKDNILSSQGAGIVADGMAQASYVFGTYAPDAVVTNNAIIGGNPGGNPTYFPTGNFFPADDASAGFDNPSARDYELLPGNQYLTMASDGTQLGADIAQLMDMTANVISGAPKGSFEPIRVHCGGGPYTDIFGNFWSADYGFTGGDVFAFDPSLTIWGTGDPALYQTTRYYPSTYTFPVPNGNYRVTLKFVENVHPNPGDRLFDVTINGTQVLSNFDIVADAGGMFIADDKSFPVTVTNGQLTISFDRDATVFAISVEKQ